MKIRGDILRTYQSIHTWTGIIAGLVLFIGFYAGSLSMFEKEISYWATPSSHHLPNIPLEEFDTLIAKASTKFDKAQQGFTINFNEHVSPLIWTEDGGGWGLQLNHNVRHATLSPQNELVTHVYTSNELGDLVDNLHRTAGIVGKVGHEDIGVLILGVAAVLYFLALVSGIIFLLPTLTKSFFALKKNKGANRFWLDSHNLVGVISLPFHIIIAITVVVFAFHNAFYGGLSVGYGDRPLFEQPQKSTVTYSIEQLPTINTYLEKVSELVTGYEVQSMAFSGLNSARPSVGITVINTQEMMRNNTGDFIYMNPYTFDVTYSSIPMSDEDVFTPLITSFFSLHFGGYGGDLGRWLYFIMGLLGAFLFYSGNLLWLEKRRQKQALQTKSNRFMASLTIGVCLGSVLAVATTLLVSKWLYLIDVQTNNHYVICYYVVFFAALIYAFTCGAAKSAINLLSIMSLVCLFIPLTTIVTLVMPSIGLWETKQVASIMVELVAFVFAGAFYYAACKTKNRAYYGERDSIWALSIASQPSTVASSQEKTSTA